MTDDKLMQVSRQCSAVRYLATELALLYGDLAKIFAAGHFPNIADMDGEKSAALMEILGDILNGADAVPEGIEWLDPIFEEAHRRWPTGSPWKCPHCGQEHPRPQPSATDA